MADKELKNAGLKLTLPRIKIFKILEGAKNEHLSAEHVYKKLKDMGEDVGLATVYRVLTQFEAAGLVKRHNFEGGHSVFEIEQGEHHDHLVCIQCGRVEEFVDSTIEKQQLAIAKSKKFRLTDHSLTLYGICKSCVL